MKPHNRIELSSIESLRGVAALMIVLYHLAEVVKLPLPAELNIIRTHFGLGVPLFYCLSGFVLAYGYTNRLETKAQLLEFYLRRFFRIAPLFYTIFAAWLAINIFVFKTTITSQSIFLNMTFLFGLVPGAHESLVWAGWSIGIEMLFYLFFPVFSLVIHNIKTSIVGFVFACILSAAVYNSYLRIGLTSYAYMNLWTHLPFFIAGMASYRIWQYFNFAKSRMGGGLLVIAVVIAAILISDQTYSFLSNLRFGAAQRNAWALVFVLLILSACMMSTPILERGPLRNIGKLSFSVYLVHPVIMLGLIKINFAERLGELSPSLSVVFLVGASVVIACVWVGSSLTYKFIEAPGIALGRRAPSFWLSKPESMSKNAESS